MSPRNRTARSRPEKILDTFPGVINAGRRPASSACLPLQHERRLIWSASSDFVGRRKTYTVLLLFGAIFYAGIPAIGTRA